VFAVTRDISGHRHPGIYNSSVENIVVERDSISGTVATRYLFIHILHSSWQQPTAAVGSHQQCLPARVIICISVASVSDKAVYL
jgi:hypothetical protein